MFAIHKWWALLLVAMYVALATVGCGGGYKTTNTTMALDYMTRGEQSQGAHRVPAKLLDPSLDGDFVIATQPGKDSDVDLWYPDGTHHLSVKTKRSIVLEALFAGAMGLDAQHYLENAAQREFFSSQMDKLIDFVDRRFPVTAPAAPTVTTLERATMWKDFLLGLKDDADFKAFLKGLIKEVATEVPQTE